MPRQTYSPIEGSSVVGNNLAGQLVQGGTQILQTLASSGGGNAPGGGNSYGIDAGGAGFQAGGSIGGIAGSAAGAALIPFIGPLGPLLGGFVGNFVGNMFNGRAFDGAGMLAGQHSPSLPPLDDTKMYSERCKTLLDYAKPLGISVEEVALVMAQDSKKTGHSMAYVWDAYDTAAASARPNPTVPSLGPFSDWMRDYNADNPQARIMPGQKGPALPVVPGVPSSAPQLPANVGTDGPRPAQQPQSYTRDAGNAPTPGTPGPPKKGLLDDETTKYAIFGGAGLVVLILLVVLLKK